MFPDQKPIIEKGRTLLPVKYVAEELGATVQWNELTRTVKMTKGSRVVTIVIDQAFLQVGTRKVFLDVPAQIINGRTMIPVKAVAEAFDCKVEWVEETHTVKITKEEEILGWD